MIQQLLQAKPVNKLWNEQLPVTVSEAVPQYLNTKDGVLNKQIRKKPKRNRTAFTTQQILALEEEFQLQEYVDRPKRMELVAKLGLSDRNIKVWFQNRRMKKKREGMPEGVSSSSFSDCSSPPHSPENLLKSLLRAKRPDMMKHESYNYEPQNGHYHSVHQHTHGAVSEYMLPDSQSSLQSQTYYHQPQYNNVQYTQSQYNQINYNEYSYQGMQYQGYQYQIPTEPVYSNAENMMLSGPVQSQVILEDDLKGTHTHNQTGFEDSGINDCSTSDRTSWTSDITAFYEGFE